MPGNSEAETLKGTKVLWHHNLRACFSGGMQSLGLLPYTASARFWRRWFGESLEAPVVSRWWVDTGASFSAQF